MICSGDVIAYGADPRATLALIRDAGIATVMGNCKNPSAPTPRIAECGFTPGSACDRLSAAWFAHASRQVDADDRRWMAALPRRIDLRLAGRRLAVVHGAPSRINRFVFASATDEALAAEIALAGADGVIGGHCDCSFTRHVGPLLWHNSGAVGLPANERHAPQLVQPADAAWRCRRGAAPAVALRSCRRGAGDASGRPADGLRGNDGERHLAELRRAAAGGTGAHRYAVVRGACDMGRGATAADTGSAAFRRSAAHRIRRTARGCRVGAAEHAVVQHRHAVQHRLRRVLHRKHAAQRPVAVPVALRLRPLPARRRRRRIRNWRRSASPAASRS